MAAQRRTRRARSIRLAVLVVASVGLTGCFDSMYPTANYRRQCQDWDQADSLKSFCQTDGLVLTYYYQSSLTAADNAALREGLDQYEPTKLDPTYQNPPSYSAGDETDIVFAKRAIPISVAGLVYCEDAATTLRCDQHYVLLKPGSVVRKMTACHEVGHAVGLTHGAEASPRQSPSAPDLGCLRTPYDLISYKLGPHNARQINDTY